MRGTGLRYGNLFSTIGEEGEDQVTAGQPMGEGRSTQPGQKKGRDAAQITHWLSCGHMMFTLFPIRPAKVQYCPTGSYIRLIPRAGLTQRPDDCGRKHI